MQNKGKAKPTYFVEATLNLKSVLRVSYNTSYNTSLRIVDDGNTISSSLHVGMRGSTYEVNYENKSFVIVANKRHMSQHNGSDPELDRELRLPHGRAPGGEAIRSGLLHMLRRGEHAMKRKTMETKKVGGSANHDFLVVETILNEVSNLIDKTPSSEIKIEDVHRLLSNR